MIKQIESEIFKVEHRAMGVLGEFKAFISKGNVMDLAVGVIIGGAFQGIVTSLVTNVVTPAITLFTSFIFHGKSPVDFQSIAIGAHQVLNKDGTPALDPSGHPLLQGGIMIGSFINQVFSFIILAAVVFFLLVKPMNKLMVALSKPVPPPDVQPPEEILLLRQIRDSLNKPQAQV